MPNFRAENYLSTFCEMKGKVVCERFQHWLARDHLYQKYQNQFHFNIVYFDSRTKKYNLFLYIFPIETSQMFIVCNDFVGARYGLHH
jgi:hypothetical protein